MLSISSLRSRLASARRLDVFHQVARGLANSVVISAALALALIAAESLIHGTVQVRTAMAASWALVTVAAVVKLVLPAALQLAGVRQGQSLVAVAHRVGDAYPDIGDMLGNVLQLADSTSGSAELRQQAYADVAESVEPLDFSVIVDKRPTRKAFVWMVFSIVLSAFLIGGLVPPFGSAFSRLLTFSTSYLPPAPYRLHMLLNDTTVQRGSTVRVQVQASGIPPELLTVWVKEHSSNRFAPFTIRRDSAASYSYVLPGMTSSMKVFAEGEWLDDGVRTDTISITVIDRPMVRLMRGRVFPPSYASISPTEISERSAEITALKGSTVDVTIASSNTLAAASIRVATVAGDTVAWPLSISGDQAKGRFVVKESGTWSVELIDKNAMRQATAVWWPIVALQDASPTIAMLRPTTNVDIDTKGLLPITVAIADDYGFSSLALFYRVVKSRYVQPQSVFSSLPMTFSSQQAVQEVSMVWDINKTGLSPEDVYEFYVEVRDNDNISGPKVARTAPLQVRLPSLDEVFADADRTQEDAAKELREIAKEAEALRKESDQLQRELQKQQAQQQTRNQQTADYKERKQAEDLLQRRQQLQEKMENVRQKLEQMTEKLQQNQAISPETLEKYMELQKLMQQVDSPELRRMQENMKKAMEKMSPEELQKAMQQAKFDEEQFRKSIERTLNLLKRIQAEQKVDELAKRAEELAERQEELRKQLENTSPSNSNQRKDLADKQEQLRKEADKMAQEAKDVQKLMKELGDQPMDQLEKAMADLNSEQTDKAMDKASEQTERGDMQEASQQQQKASQNLQRFAQQMKQLKREMKKRGAKEAVRQMQKSMNDMLDLSKQQENLRDQSQSMDAQSAQAPSLARQQQRLQEAMANVANEMMALAQKSMDVTPDMAQDMGNALQSMKDAMQNLQDRRGQMAAQQQSQAMSSMNSAISKMSDALGQMMQGDGQGQGGSGQNPGMGDGKGQSPFQRLQSLADQQQQINQGSQQVGQNGQQMSEQQRAEMGRLAQQQGKALQAMQELAKDQERAPAGSKKPVGDLKAIAEDMKEVMTDMQTGSITPETRMRQERILSRLLNASRSVNDRDYEKQRESRTGTDVTRRSPAALDEDLLEGRQRSQKDILESVREQYTRDYETLIRLYFDALQRANVNANR
jgi:hypothetical protein